MMKFIIRHLHTAKAFDNKIRCTSHLRVAAIPGPRTLGFSEYRMLWFIEIDNRERECAPFKVGGHFSESRA